MMSRFGTRLWVLWSDRRAQDMVEYSLTAAFVAVAISAIVPPGIVENFDTIFSKVNVWLVKAKANG